jgi:hypothetical protein
LETELQLGGHRLAGEMESILTCQRTRPHDAALPFDILGLIFHHVTDGYPMSLRSLLFVCRSWHDAVWLHPTLWSTIRIDHTLLTIFALNSVLPKLLIKRYIRTCLNQSGTAALDISIDLNPQHVNSFSTQDTAHEHDTWSFLVSLTEDIIGPDGEHAARWRSLTWKWTTREYISQVIPKLPPILPVFETLRLSNSPVHISLIGAFPRCPRLLSLVLHHTSTQLLKVQDCLLLSELVISTEFVWLSVDLIRLSQLPNIRRLTLYTIQWAVPIFQLGSGRVPPTEILLPHLKYLHLRGRIPLQVVEPLVTPSLKELELNSHSSLELLGEISLPRTIETIRIAYSDRDSDPSIDVVRPVKKLLDVAPALKQVCVPKWFHDKLEKNGFHLEGNVIIVIE